MPPKTVRLTPSDRDAIRTVKYYISLGQLRAQNPGWQEYRNEGGHVATRLPPIPPSDAYYEYRIGGGTPGEQGFRPGVGPAGARRLVLHVSPREKDGARYQIISTYFSSDHYQGFVELN